MLYMHQFITNTIFKQKQNILNPVFNITAYNYAAIFRPIYHKTSRWHT